MKNNGNNILVNEIGLLIPAKVKERIDEILTSQPRKFINATYIKAYTLAYILLKNIEEQECLIQDFSIYWSVKNYLKPFYGQRFYLDAFLALSAPEPGSSLDKINSSKKRPKFEDAVYQSDGNPITGESCMYFRINPSLLDGESIVVNTKKQNPSLFARLYPKQRRHFIKTINQLYIDDIALFDKIHLELNPMRRFEDGLYFVERNFNDLMNSTDETPRKIVYSKIRFKNQPIKVTKPKPIAYIEAYCNNISKKHNDSYDIIIESDTAIVDKIDDYLVRKKENMEIDLKRKVAQIINKQFFAEISSSNGRLHTNFTSLNNQAIKYLRFKNEEGDDEFLNGLDLRSSQPTILANLLQKDELFINSLKSSKNPELIRHLDFFLKLEIDATHGNQFLHACLEQGENGFYEQLASTIELNGDSDVNTSSKRSIAKKEMMRVLFTSSKFKSSLVDMEKVFPGVLQIIRQIKQAFEIEFNDDKNHFTLFLQLIEAYIFIEKVYLKFAEKDIPSFTKHDSILFPRNFEDYITNDEGYRVNVPSEKISIINDVFSDIGFKGRLKITNYLYLDTRCGFGEDWDFQREYPSATYVVDGRKIRRMYGKFND